MRTNKKAARRLRDGLIAEFYIRLERWDGDPVDDDMKDMLARHGYILDHSRSASVYNVGAFVRYNIPVLALDA